MTTEPTALLTIQDSIATITLNRPQALNAVTTDMVERVGKALERCRAEDIRAVVITGAGRAFCAGADLRGMAGEREPSRSPVMGLAQLIHTRIITGIRNLPKPVVGMVNGAAAGAGLGIALACDLRVASEDARFIMAFGGIGGSADSGTTYFLPRLIGPARTAELHFLNEPLPAQRALEWGLVNRVYSPTELAGKTQELAKRLAAGPTAAYGRLKRLLNATWGHGLEEHLQDEAEAIAASGATEDWAEGVRAFVEKRPPVFRGR
jgi:2-(1,2-epoxy-1,2-dihydrophenyl)acetyl-CoA isomerase